MSIFESKRRRTSPSGVAVLCLAMTAACGVTGEEPQAESTRGIMGEVVQALQVALPLSLDSATFADPANRATILDALNRLADGGERLERHGAHGEASFAFLSHSLARDTRDIERRFEAGRTDEARFLLQHTTEMCVACHTRLPDATERPLGRNFMAEEALAALPPDQRAEFEMATRQFEAAATSFESVLADPANSPADLDLEGIPDTYLELCLRVLNDRARAGRSLRLLLKRDDLPDLMRRNVDAWVASLADLPEFAPDASPVDEARKWVAHAKDRSKFRDDRQALVPLVAASGLLHRFLESRNERSPEVGEAYYLLGLIDASVGRSFWASQTEPLLETAIRIGPGEPYAPKALALLEEFVVAGYTGSAGTHVPPDERRRLDELGDLIEAATDS